jgi:hypothetical protein
MAFVFLRMPESFFIELLKAFKAAFAEKSREFALDAMLTLQVRMKQCEYRRHLLSLRRQEAARLRPKAGFLWADMVVGIVDLTPIDPSRCCAPRGRQERKRNILFFL